jgi:Phage phiEco32-like COOH.NH2 ligase-type 2
MHLAEMKSEILKHWATSGGLPLTPELKAGIPEKYLARWERQWQEIPVLDGIPTNPRLANRFTVGADPEFTLMGTNGTMGQAHQLGLHAGLAFGMDTNGRLVELRPAPSRFVLDIVASILAELRWMALLVPATMDFGWYGKAFDGLDGVGGHIHFARKRGTAGTSEEARHLDLMFDDLMEIGVLNKKGCSDRMRQTHYGRHGDYRIQRHGYEYRSLPTWLDSPQLAYLCITLSKLVLLQPEMYHKLAKTIHRFNVGMRKAAILDFIRHFKNEDDDAVLLLRMIEVNGWPAMHGMDFRTQWGIMYAGAKDINHIVHVPTVIEATTIERVSIFNALTQRMPVAPDMPQVNWLPTHYPDKYISLLSNNTTHRRIGIGELSSGLVQHISVPIYLTPYERPNSLVQLPHKYATKALREGVEAFRKKVSETITLDTSSAKDYFQFHISTKLRGPEFSGLFKDFMVSGLFPIWKATEVAEGHYEKWFGQLGQMKGQPKRYKGKELKGE